MKLSVLRGMWVATVLAFVIVMSAASAPGPHAGYGALPRDDGPPPDPSSEDETLPLWTPPRDGPGTENQIIVYHADTGTTENISLSAVVDMPDAASVPGHFAPLEAQTYQPDSFGSLSLVTNPSDWPWSAHVKLIRTFPTGIVSSAPGC